MTDEELTLDEMQRVLATKRFATIHDLVDSSAFDDLTDGSGSQSPPESTDAAASLSELPSRR